MNPGYLEPVTARKLTAKTINGEPWRMALVYTP